MPQPSSRQTVTFKVGDQPVPGYRLARELGRGTFGVVWLAVTENGFERALKVVNLEQKGGKKEFRALRLIKDRKILHGNLLTLIDYWLLDRDGNILSTPNNITLESQIVPKKPGSGLAQTTALGGEAAKVKVTPLQGTMIPSNSPSSDPEDGNYNIRETFQQSRVADTTEEENSQAIWLVVAMELGHKTLHDRQKEHTHEITAKTLTKFSRMGATAVDKGGDTDGGTGNRKPPPQRASDDDDLSPLPADEVLPYMEQAARGLDYLHRCEIVHRDVKPQNIMLVGDVAKVCDYGLASELGDIRATTNAFTLPYAAPEAINKNQPTPASDQYSLAVTYVELRTGRWPFVSNTSTAVYAAKDTGVHHLKFVPNRNVRAVLKKALSKKPQDRYPSCGEFVKQLAKAEGTRFNLFATVQAALASLAILTVILAAAATHPDIWAQIKPFLPKQIVPALGPQFNLADYQSRLSSAEQLLQTNQRAGALQAFGNLYELLKQLPEKEVELKNDTILGFARAQAGAQDILKDTAQRDAVVNTIEPLVKSNGPPLQGKQELQLHYLRVITLEKQQSTTVSPDSQLARDSLADWERQLWKDALVRYQAPAIKDLLDTVIAHRKEASSDSRQAAHAGLEQLRIEAANTVDLPHSLRHQIDIEELHLNYGDDDPQHVQNLEALQNYLEQEITLDQRLVERAHLLRLLILKETKGMPLSFLDPSVSEIVAAVKPEVFDESRLQEMHFAQSEIDVIEELRDGFQAEVRDALSVLPELARAALPHLITKREAFQLLSDRLRSHLSNTELNEAQLPAIDAAWTDLRSYLDKDYQPASLSGREQQDAIQTEADLSLEVSFANPQADPAEALKEFINRVVKSGRGEKWFQKLLARAQQNPAWVKAAAIPLQSLLNSPPDDLSGNRNLADWKAKVESLLLRDVLQADPADPAAIQTILAALSRDAADGKGPLPTLLRVECEFLSNPNPPVEKRTEWESKVNKSLSLIGSSDPELKMYGSFVRARLLAGSSNGFQQEEAVKVVSELLTRPNLPTWFTPARRQGAGDIFGIAAIKSLKLDDQDILRFADLSLSNNSQLMQLQAIAKDSGVQAPALRAVAGIIQATQGEDTDWQQVHQLIAGSRTDPHTVAMFERYHAGRLLEYVENLTALRAAPADAPLDPQIIASFHRLLMTRQETKYDYFSFADGSRDNDEGVLQNIVNPVLLHAWVAKEGTVPAKELAFLWGAKGRLLQRSPLIVSIDPAKQTDLRDSTTVAITLANQAFDRARKLDSNINYVVGYGRTLAALPADPAVRDDRLQRLSALIDEHDPQGKSTNLGMRFLFAYVLRFKSYEKNDVPNIKAAGTRYEEVLKELPADDPYELDSLCREGLSDIHLRLAFLNSQTTTEEVRALLRGEEPATGSKAYHLQLAVKYATEATQSSGRNQKENAYTALANAYEDYAYYLGLSEYYGKSKDAFGFAISSARDRGLPVAKAQMNYGRCLYRYAIDPYAGFANNAERIEILNLAVSQLNEAVESDKLRPSDEVEASFWLGVDKLAIGNLSAASVRLTMNEEALAHFHQASESAAKYQLADMQLLTLAQESEATLDLYGMYTALKDPLRQPSMLKQAQAIDDVAFQLFSRSPQSANAAHVTTLASNASLIWRGEAPKRIRWLEGSPAIRAQWNANDTWKFEAITLRLGYAMLAEGKDEVTKARAILATMTGERLKNLAEARILDFEAAVGYQAFEKTVNADPDITQAKLQAEVEKPLLLFIAAKRLHDQNLDPEAKRLVDRINATSATQLKNLARDLTVVEKKKLQDVLTRSPDLEARKRLFKLCNLSLLTMGSDTKLAAKKNERARLAHDAIKPFFVFADNETIFAGLRDVKDKHQVGLDAFERQLKQAGEKFDAKPSR